MPRSFIKKAKNVCLSYNPSPHPLPNFDLNTMGAQNYPTAAYGPRNSKTKGVGSHSGSSTESLNLKAGQRRQGARTATGPLKVVSREWPRKVPPPAAICKPPGKGQSSHSQPSTTPVQVTSTPSLRDPGDHCHMSPSSELDIETCVQRDENANFDTDSGPPPNSKAVHLIVTRRSTSTFVASLMPDPTTPKPLWHFEHYDTSHEVTTSMYLHQSKD